MELTDNIKNKIDNFFENHSENEIKEAFKKIGLELDEPKELTDDDLSVKEAFNKLYKDIYNKGMYLKDYTYSEYDHCFEFANRLMKLINRLYE